MSFREVRVVGVAAVGLAVLALLSALAVLALLSALAVRPAVFGGSMCHPVARFGFASVLGFPAGWVLVPVVGAVVAAVVGRLIAPSLSAAPSTVLRRWWVLPAVMFVALYVPYGPVAWGLLPPPCFG